ncbi:MAG TPA: ABC-F family ATP-binding cassette domain-containing protein [Pantanalinema sp.]
MITLSGVSKHFPTKTVLDEVDWHVSPGDRVGLVGPNGAGKSTLLKILLGETGPDEGRVLLRPKATIGYLSQELPGIAGRTLQAEMWTAFSALQAQADRLAQLADELTHASDPAELSRLTMAQAQATEAFEAMGGYTVETRIGKVLSGLGFSESDRARLVESFSGGWQMRVTLAKLLLLQPDLLLLDEPTNHLDLDAIEWLEDYLRDYPGTVVVISHDRRFLDRVVTRISELEQSRIDDYACNYTTYLDQKKERVVAQQVAFDRQARELSRQQAFVEKFRASATRSTQAKSREKQLAKIERLEAPTVLDTVRFRFPPAPPSGLQVLSGSHLAKAYGAKPVITDLSLKLERGQRLALVGPNGCGKSTLLRMLAQQEEPDDGEAGFGYNVKPAYYSQHQADQLNDDQSVLDEAYRSVEGDTWTLERTRSLLARFLFRGEDVFKPVSKLSGGERARLCLAKMLMKPSNLLLLDEPTNHLDLGSKEMLADALEEFAGSVILISHDRYLLDRVATHVLAFGEGGPRLHVGNYTAYREQNARPQLASDAPAKTAPRSAPQPEAAPSEAPAKKPKLNAFQRSRRIEALETEIAELEARISELEALIADPALYEDHVRAAAVTADFDESRARHEAATEEWLDLSDD